MRLPGDDFWLCPHYLFSNLCHFMFTVSLLDVLCLLQHVTRYSGVFTSHILWLFIIVIVVVSLSLCIMHNVFILRVFCSLHTVCISHNGMCITHFVLPCGLWSVLCCMFSFWLNVLNLSEMKLVPTPNIILCGRPYSATMILQYIMRCFADRPSTLLTIRNLLW